MHCLLWAFMSSRRMSQEAMKMMMLAEVMILKYLQYKLLECLLSLKFRTQWVRLSLSFLRIGVQCCYWDTSSAEWLTFNSCCILRSIFRTHADPLFSPHVPKCWLICLNCASKLYWSSGVFRLAQHLNTKTLWCPCLRQPRHHRFWQFWTCLPVFEGFWRCYSNGNADISAKVSSCKFERRILINVYTAQSRPLLALSKLHNIKIL